MDVGHQKVIQQGWLQKVIFSQGQLLVTIDRVLKCDVLSLPRQVVVKAAARYMNSDVDRPTDRGAGRVLTADWMREWVSIALLSKARVCIPQGVT